MLRYVLASLVVLGLSGVTQAQWNFCQDNNKPATVSKAPDHGCTNCGCALAAKTPVKTVPKTGSFNPDPFGLGVQTHAWRGPGYQIDGVASRAEAEADVAAAGGLAITRPPAVQRIYPQPVSASSGHTHTCPNPACPYKTQTGRAFSWGEAGHGHACRHCGTSQYVQDPFPRTTMPTPAYAQQPSFTLPTAGGGCANGQCSTGSQFIQNERTGIFGGGGLFGRRR